MDMDFSYPMHLVEAASLIFGGYKSEKKIITEINKENQDIFLSHSTKENLQLMEEMYC